MENVALYHLVKTIVTALKTSKSPSPVHGGHTYLCIADENPIFQQLGEKYAKLLMLTKEHISDKLRTILNSFYHELIIEMKQEQERKTHPQRFDHICFWKKRITIMGL